MSKKVWLTYFVIFVLLAIATFSPLVIPYNISTPWLFGMPRTLWAGILISILMAGLTLVAATSIKEESEE